MMENICKCFILFIVHFTQADGVSYIIQEIYGIENKKDGSKDKVFISFLVNALVVFHQYEMCCWFTKVMMRFTWSTRWI